MAVAKASLLFLPRSATACARGAPSGATWAASPISGARVARELDRIIAWRGKPEAVLSDNGTELTSNAILAWPDERRIE